MNNNLMLQIPSLLTFSNSTCIFVCQIQVLLYFTCKILSIFFIFTSMPFIYKLKSTEVNTTSTWLFKYSSSSSSSSLSSSSFAASKSCACVRKVRAMALEAVVYPQPQDPFGYGIKDHNLLADVELSNWGYEDFNLNLENEEQQGGSISICSFLENQTENYPCVDWSPQSMEVELPHKNEQNMSNPSSDASNCNTHNLDSSTSTPSRPKRRRARSRKNKEEIENQRMTHIAVERNRRKQMNEYLSVLRSIMPESYVPRVLHLSFCCL